MLSWKSICFCILLLEFLKGFLCLYAYYGIIVLAIIIQLFIFLVSAIGLALLTCSTRVHCNPDKHCLIERKSSNSSQKSVEQTLSENSKDKDIEILAPETQAITPSRPKTTEGKIIGNWEFFLPILTRTDWVKN